MFLHNLNNRIIQSAATVCLLASSGCSMIYDDLPECPAELRVQFIYDYNLKFADAFAHEVKSVNVWAFNTTDGRLVWSDTASGAALAEKDFSLVTPLGEGTYDFVSWCGLEGNADFDLATYTPASKEELEVKLRTISGSNGSAESRSHLPGLYHGMVLSETYTVAPTEPTFKTVTVPLIKDTNNIRVLLQRVGSKPMAADDFDVSITLNDVWLAWNNKVMPGSPTVDYLPWDTREVQAVSDDTESGREASAMSGVIYDFSSSRLMTTDRARLTVRSNSSGTTIINIPIIDYFILVKGHYGEMSDQEYLDRQDDYSILLFVDDNNQWYLGGGIYINSWAVVPPQGTII